MSHFPVPSTSLKRTGRQFHEYTELLKAMLKLLECTGDVGLLKLLHTTLQETQHVHRATIQTSLKELSSQVSAHAWNNRIVDAMFGKYLCFYHLPRPS